MSAKSLPVLEPRQLNDADESILETLREGRATPGYIAEQIGHKPAYVNQRLRRLEEHGHVQNLARGLWELEDDPRLADGHVDAVNETDEHLENHSTDVPDRQELRQAIDDLEAALETGDLDIDAAIQRLREAAGIDNE